MTWSSAVSSPAGRPAPGHAGILGEPGSSPYRAHHHRLLGRPGRPSSPAARKLRTRALRSSNSTRTSTPSWPRSTPPGSRQRRHPRASRPELRRPPRSPRARTAASSQTASTDTGEDACADYTVYRNGTIAGTAQRHYDYVLTPPPSPRPRTRHRRHSLRTPARRTTPPGCPAWVTTPQARRRRRRASANRVEDFLVTTGSVAPTSSDRLHRHRRDAWLENYTVCQQRHLHRHRQRHHHRFHRLHRPSPRPRARHSRTPRHRASKQHSAQSTATCLVIHAGRVLVAAGSVPAEVVEEYLRRRRLEVAQSSGPPSPVHRQDAGKLHADLPASSTSIFFANAATTTFTSSFAQPSTTTLLFTVFRRLRHR